MAPALAVAEALRADGAEVVFVGGDRAEAQLVPQAGYPLHGFSSLEGLSRRNPLRAARALARAALALPRARSLLRELSPDAVLGGGGYVAGPVGLAAVSLRIPLVLTEADSRLGLANRLLAPRRAADLPVVSDLRPRRASRERRALSRHRTSDTRAGRRARGRAGALRDRPRADVRADLRGIARRPLDQRRGDRGPRAASRLGRRRVARAAHRRPARLPGAVGRVRRPGYDLREYLDLAEFAQALAAADLVVARAGGSVFEIAAYGLPAILVPYPHASADHQSANARWMADAGAAVVVADRELTGARLAREVSELLADRARLAAMAGASRGLARPDAAREVARELLEAARR